MGSVRFSVSQRRAVNLNTLHDPPGSALLNLCQGTTQELVLAAPFMKIGVIEPLLLALSDDVRLTCITRWHLSDIVTGVSDLEIYGAVKQHGGQLWLRQDLHAKYYRGDHVILLGSANLTAAGLGWTTKPNLELLVPVAPNVDEVAHFEEVALANAVRVDDDLYQTMLAATRELGDLHSGAFVEPLPVMQSHATPLSLWIPSTRDPACLYPVYQDAESDDLPPAVSEAGKQDLAVMRLPPGLPKNAFEKAVGVALLPLPVINLIDREVIVSQRFGTIRTLLQERLGLSQDEAARAWQTLIRWLRYFLPDRYEYSRPRHSEIITRTDRAREPCSEAHTLTDVWSK